MTPALGYPAWLELLQAAAGYELARPGRGLEFVGDVIDRWKVLCEHHALGPRVDHEFRKFPLKHFPYAVLYRIEDETPTIAAIVDGRRSRNYWRKNTAWVRELPGQYLAA